MNSRFRDATARDLELLVELRLEYIRADLEPLDDRGAAAIADQLRAWIPANLGERFFACLAFVDGVPAGVGMLAVNEFPANPHFPAGRTGTVLNVWTRAPYRRKGIATATVRRLIDLGGQLGLDRLELSASEAGGRLYRSLGFVEVERSHLPMLYLYGEG